MALTERKEVERIEIVGDNIQIREATVVEKDGVEIARSYHRKVKTPLCDCSNEDARVQSVAGVIHTAEAKAKAQAAEDARVAEAEKQQPV